jgi:hypothetical protein
VARRIDLPEGEDHHWVCLTPDGKRLLTGEAWRKVSIWGVASGRRSARLVVPAERDPDSDPRRDEAWHVAISSDGRLLAVAYDGSLWVWDLSLRRILGQFDTLKNPLKRVRGPIAFSADGRYLSWFGEFGSLVLSETATGEIVHRIERADQRFCTFAPRGWRLAAGDANDGSTLVWDLGLICRSLPLRKGVVAADPASLWPLLAISDAAVAHAAAWRMAALQGVEGFLAQRLRPVGRPDEGRLKALIADLGADDAGRRAEAEAALAPMRAGAAEALRRAEKSDDLEPRLRARRLLARLLPRSPESLREVRAVLALEARGTPEAAALLRRLAGGIPEARLTREAGAALARLRRR